MTDSRRTLVPDEHPGASQRGLKARYPQSVAGLKLKKYQKTLDFPQKERTALANEIPVEILQQIFDLTVTHSEAIMAYFYGRTVPSRFVRKPQPKT